MKLSTLMTIKAIVCIFTGIIFLFFPEQWLWLLRVDLNLPGTYMARLFGATFLLVGLFLWMIREVSDPTTRRAVVLAIFIGDSAAFVVSLLAQLSGVINPFGWGIVIIYFLLALSFGYFQFAQPRLA